MADFQTPVDSPTTTKTGTEQEVVQETEKEDQVVDVESIQEQVKEKELVDQEGEAEVVSEEETLMESEHQVLGSLHILVATRILLHHHRSD